MRVCIVSKFPPIEGGIASRTYWQVRGLLEQGHDVTVVTNAGATESEYLIRGCEDHLQGLQARYPFQLRDVGGDAPWHIPAGPDHLERLLNGVLSALEGYRFDVVESGYLVPYGIAAGVASRMCALPHVIRHGGSDLAKLLPHPQYRDLLARICREADHVVTDTDNSAVLEAIGAKVRVEESYLPGSRFFKATSPRTCPASSYGYVGKINYHWRRRGLDQIVGWHGHQQAQGVRLRIVGQGTGKADFERWMESAIGRALPIEDFVPPWEMPRLLNELDCLFSLSVGEPLVSRSMTAAEAEAVGLAVVRDLSPGAA